jgi:hypothetical protein
MTTEELELIEDSNKEAKEAIALGEAFKRLLENEDYQKVISNGYIKDYAKELGMAIAMNTGAYDTDKMIEDLKGINAFVGYGFKVANAHMAAEQDLIENARYVAETTEVEE